MIQIKENQRGRWKKGDEEKIKGGEIVMRQTILRREGGRGETELSGRLRRWREKGERWQGDEE